MKHLDLFSGIGGFALAVDTVWPGSEHIFCDNNKFCQMVLKNHWPNSKIYGDIRAITDADWNRPQEPGPELKTGGDRQLPETSANAESGQSGEQTEQEGRKDTSGRDRITGNSQGQRYTEEREVCQSGLNSKRISGEDKRWNIDLLTGGFPCQPFSAAGKRRGTEDDRHLWPEMLRVIRLTQPTWVIVENVRGLTTIDGGLVFEQVCLDLEASGYEVQPFIIPAVAVNAPHRRDRVWFVAHAVGDYDRTQKRKDFSKTTGEQDKDGTQECSTRESIGTTDGERGKRYAESQNVKGELGTGKQDRNTPYPQRTRYKGNFNQEGQDARHSGNGWQQNWLEVATELCGMDDGLSCELDGFKLTKAGHRVERLKSLGNSIVPQVAIEIMKSIKLCN